MNNIIDIPLWLIYPPIKQGILPTTGESIPCNCCDCNFTFTVGEVKTVDSEYPAKVTNVGTDQNIILNFEIPRGYKGPRGEQGISPTINIESVKTLEPDQDAYVINNGTNTDVELEFGIPRGKDCEFKNGNILVITFSQSDDENITNLTPHIIFKYGDFDVSSSDSEIYIDPGDYTLFKIMCSFDGDVKSILDNKQIYSIELLITLKKNGNIVKEFIEDTTISNCSIKDKIGLSKSCIVTRDFNFDEINISLIHDGLQVEQTYNSSSLYLEKIN